MKYFIGFLIFCVLVFADKPKMAIVVDDLGYSLAACQELANYTQALNLAVIPGQAYSKKCAEIIKNSPHQLLIHFPWGPLGWNAQKKYPIRIESSLSSENIQEMLTGAFASVPEADGINNHMGSGLSEDEKRLNIFFEAFSKFKDSKYFLDSKTSRRSKAYQYAKKYGVHTTVNNAFLDGRQNERYIEQEFRIAVHQAQNTGAVVAICHGNRKVTMRVLKKLMTKYNADVDYVYLPEIILFREAR